MTDKTVSVLIIEDDRDTRDLMNTILKHQGMACTTASDVTSALEAISTSAFDTILLDIGLSGQRNGYDFLESLQSSNPDLLPRTLVVTGMAPSMLEGIAKFRCGIVSKPFDVDDLVERTREAARREQTDHQPGT